MRKPDLSFWQIWNMSFGFFGIQIGFALQGANVSRIFQSLGASVDSLPILWIAGPVTGLLVQPLVGHFSDRTWTWLGRRRPYFLAGAVLTVAALIIMPLAPYLWVAALSLWVLDASINVAMEPFRAVVGDLLPARQRTAGFALQSVFIGSGALLASMAPYVLSNVFGVSNTAPPGVVPDAVRLAFFIGAAALFIAIGWTVLTTREYSPAQMQAFSKDDGQDMAIDDAAAIAWPPARFARAGLALALAGVLINALVYGLHADKQFYVLGGALVFLGLAFLLNSRLVRAGKTANFFSAITGDLVAMPKMMRRLAIVQFFSWAGFFVMWIYTTPAVTAHAYGATDPASAAYNTGANWVGVMFAVYNGVAAVYALFLPRLAKTLGRRLLHAINLLAGGLGLASVAVFTDPWLLLLSMAGVGMAWASVLSLPYALLIDALPAKKLGVYMGIFNFFITLPQIMVSGTMGPVARTFLGNDPVKVMVLGGFFLVLAAVSVAWVHPPAKAGARGKGRHAGAT